MTDNQTETQDAPKIVEGSDGYLIEVDGEIVPNYDATINVFNEGDIVSGKVVRIDKDEVLVDIGYKSEGVIPVNELSIRKNVNTQQEVELGEEVDYVTTLFGRRRPIPELKSSNYRLRSLGERLAVNSVLQGTAADIIKVAMLEVQRRLEEGRMAARLVLQVHDELVVEAPEAEVEAVKALLRAAMCGAYKMEPALEVDVGAGADWHGAK